MKHGKINEVYWSGKLSGYAIHCPACGWMHVLDLTWKFNGDMDKPTFTPSLLVTGSTVKRCHSYITDGQICYLKDCSHDMAGQKVDLESFDMLEEGEELDD